VRIANPSSATLTSIASTVPAVGHGRVNPSDYVAGLSRAAARSRIAVLETGVACEPAIGEALERGVAMLAKQFAPPPRVRFEELDLCYALGDTISKVEAATLHGDAMRDRPGDFSQAVYSRTEPGLHLPAVRYVEALNLRARLLQAFLAGPLGEADVLVCPTLPVPVPLAADADMERPGRVFDVVPRLTALTRPFNYLGVPVLSMPVGLDGASMPIGMQLVGRPFSEARLLAVAHLLAAALDWPALARARPPASA